MLWTETLNKEGPKQGSPSSEDAKVGKECELTFSSRGKTSKLYLLAPAGSVLLIKKGKADSRRIEEKGGEETGTSR